MSNKMLFTFAWLVTCLVFVVAPSAWAEEFVYKNYWEYPEWEILKSRSFDGMDLEEIARFRWLAERGEAMHEAMLAVLWQCDEWYYAGLALDMLHSSKGDKTKVWPELRRLLADRLPYAIGKDKTDACRSIAIMLAEHGGEDDVKALIPMLTHFNSQLRYVAAKYLGEYGNESTLEILEAAKDENAPPVARQRYETALESIRKRITGGPTDQLATHQGVIRIPIGDATMAE